MCLWNEDFICKVGSKLYFATKKPHSMLHNSNRLVMFLIKERNNAAVIQPFKMIELNGLQYVNEFEIQKTPSGGEY